MDLLTGQGGGQPRSQGSLLPVPTERERRVEERTWERGSEGEREQSAR